MLHPDDRRGHGPTPLTSGTVAAVLHTTEPRLSEKVRRGHVDPPPTIVSGRRLWFEEQVLQAAGALGVLDDACRRRIRDAFRPHHDASDLAPGAISAQPARRSEA